MGLTGKKIVLGISGSIASYKCPDLVRILRDLGAEIRVVMTSAAKAFITPLTLHAVSNYPVSEDAVLEPFDKAAIAHIELARWADIIIIAPATADLLARIAMGMANDLLSEICLATNAPIVAVPAMNQQMYRAAVTQDNVLTLQKRGVLFLGPENGNQACGDIGTGCMLKPWNIATQVSKFFLKRQDLKHLQIMVTAGPTREALDPVRFISSYSSGKMGFSIASAAAGRGAHVTLIAGPVSLSTPISVTRVNVTSALEMKQEVQKRIDKQNIFISCAAVADYRAESVSDKKIKKQNDQLVLKLVKNPDIIADVASMTKKRPFVVGFAAETENMKEYAQQKLLCKNLDLICANDVSIADHGFNGNRNALHLFWRGGEKCLELSDKTYLSQFLIDEILRLYDKKNRY